jgi:hypothetical protein
MEATANGGVLGRGRRGHRRRARYGDAAELIPGFAPENELERAVASDPELLRGLAWGRPRPGHPEGRVGAHVADLLERIDARGEPEPRRSELRLIALVHDSFKHEVRERLPRTGRNHHAMRARRFAERYIDDERLLSVIELHDRPYAIWRRMRRTGRLDERALRRMMERVPDLDLFVAFVELDGSTEGKDFEPIRWLHAILAERLPARARRTAARA